MSDTSQHQLSAIAWNMEWKRPSSLVAQIMAERMVSQAPDIICLTETYRTIALPQGHSIEGEEDWGYPQVEDRRKVMLWSRWPWEEVDTVGRSAMPSGRYVKGRTVTPIGSVTVIGVCIPWSHAHVQTGRRDRTPWQDHLAFLEGLREIASTIAGPAILLGDFNQHLPRRKAPKVVHAAMEEALGETFTVHTRGLIEPLAKCSIDHIASTSEFHPTRVFGLSNFGPDGTRLSDHFGIGAALRLDAPG